jgi:hypothetical protein
LSARTAPAPSLAALLALAACAGAPPAPGPVPGSRAASLPSAQSGGADGSYDWHGLLIVPFGTVLKASPVRLHEVLLFHDAAQSPAADPQDCYAVDGAPPRFLGAAPEDYLLCFGHDRLNRIDASVRVANAQAEQTFARACALWLKSSTPAPGTDRRCAGRDAGVAFSARLADLPGESDARLSMTLSPVAADDAAGAAVPVPGP